MAVTIRSAQLSDLDAVMAVEQAAHSHPWPVSVMQRYLEKDDVCWVVQDQQQVCAHAVVQVIAGEAELLTIAVDPACQGRGFGQQLLQHVLDRAVTARAEQIFLEVRESNIAAITLYEKNGFCEVGRRPNYYPVKAIHSVNNPPGARSTREDALLFALPLVE